MDNRAQNLYQNSRNNSVAHTEEEIRTTKTKLRNAKRKSFNLGFKRGIIIGSVVTIMSMSGLLMGVNSVTPYINGSYNHEDISAGYHAVIDATRPASEAGKYYYDYSAIASSYSPEEDIHLFIKGAYNKVGWNQASREQCMDAVIRSLHNQGHIDNNSFLSYCATLGAVKEENGELKIDSEKYEKLMKEYTRNINEQQKLSEKINEFPGMKGL